MKKAIQHFLTITKHKIVVLKLCFKAGILWQGIIHDLSKYAPEEFMEGVKYYIDGKKSPIVNCKNKNGYSVAWLHHFGRNKHHHEYWYDYNTENQTPIMPYKYLVEKVCDDLAAGMVYNGKNWHKATQLEYWLKEKSNYKINPLVAQFLETIFREVADNGIKEVINRKNLKHKYNLIVLKKR